MVDETNTELIKLPFKPEGLIFLISSTKELIFSLNWFSSKLILPSAACIVPALSFLYATRPLLMFSIVDTEFLVVFPYFSHGTLVGNVTFCYPEMFTFVNFKSYA